MAALPNVNGDNNVWGGELNTWLVVQHNADGTHGPGLGSNSLISGQANASVYQITPNSATYGLISTGSNSQPDYSIIPVAGGGTGQSVLPQAAVMVGNSNGIGFVPPVAPGYVLTDNGPGQPPSYQYGQRPSKIITFTTTGNGRYTPSPNIKAFIVEVVSDGGGGGGCVSQAASSGGGGGGGGGGYARKLYLAPLAATYKYSVGSGGAGGTSNGGAGQGSIFDIINISGGNGGGGASAGAVGDVVSGGAGANISTGGDFNGVGSGGSVGFSLGATVGAISGVGGAACMYSGYQTQQGSANSGAAGFQGRNPGGGGNGGLVVNGSASVTGGNGRSGIIIITEFS